ncbi:MAG: endonuclease/exonuclease/phosphatase family protein [Bacteroidota bacterium]
MRYSTVVLLVFLTLALHAQRNGPAIKVMTYNIWNGFDWGKDTLRHDQTVDWIAGQAPDVVALQELCGYSLDRLVADAATWGHSHVQLLKTEGYPTALTSREPITLIEKNVEDFWHGLIHAETYGIEFYVVHLSPADVDFRMKEASQIVDRVRGREGPFIILGDFNCHSPIDAQAMERKTALRERRQPKEDATHNNLRLGEFDYSVMSQFLALPALDLALGREDLTQCFTFPAPVLVGLYDHTPQSIIENRVRIDYILASPELSKRCQLVEIFNGGVNDRLSDHYPVMAEFELPE